MRADKACRGVGYLERRNQDHRLGAFWEVDEEKRPFCGAVSGGPAVPGIDE